MLYGLPHRQRHADKEISRPHELLAFSEIKQTLLGVNKKKEESFEESIIVPLTELFLRVSLIHRHHKQTVEKQ